MSFTEDQFNQQQKIEQFLKGGLTEAEGTQFKQRFDSNPELAKEVDFYSNLKFTLKHENLIKTNQKIKDIIAQDSIQPDFDLTAFDKLDLGKGPWWSSMGTLLTIGIIIAALIGGGLFFRQQQQQLAPQPELTQQYLTPFENLIATGTLDENSMRFQHLSRLFTRRLRRFQHEHAISVGLLKCYSVA